MDRLISSVLAALICAGMTMGQPPVGFRTDGTGRYPDATPLVTWGRDTNVVWKTALTSSNAIPVIWGDKIFTCAEPCVLLCINKADGTVIWRKESFFKEIPLTEEEQTQLEIERKLGQNFAKQQSAVDKEINAVRKQVKECSISKDLADSVLDRLKRQSEDIKTKRKALTVLNRYTEPGKGAGGYHPTGGYSSATPVTDGKHVYVLFGNGLVACYDFAGNRQWLKLIEHPTAAYGHGASPVLVKDKLLVHFDQLVALNTADGSEAWRVKLTPYHGTPAHTRIADEDVIFTPTGCLVRVRDGKVLADKLGSCGPNSPLVQEGKVFWAAGNARAYALPASEVPVKWTPIWKAGIKGGGYWFPSPILHKGLLYALSGNSIFTVLDAETGKKVYDERLELGGGQSYPSLTLAGDYLFASSDNGTTLVLELGRAYKEIARNTLEPFRSSLVFEGKRMYVRTLKHLWCIGE
jgi:outer membrane protein assembly factor BamB